MQPRSVLLRLALLGATGILAPATAQVSHIAGTGCGATTTYVGGTPAIGQPISLSNSFAPCWQGVAALAIGVQPLSVPLPGCPTAQCILGVVPFDLTIGGGSIWRTLWIPNVPALRGLCFRVQAGCVNFTAGCVQLDQAAQVCIQ